MQEPAALVIRHRSWPRNRAPAFQGNLACVRQLHGRSPSGICGVAEHEVRGLPSVAMDTPPCLQQASYSLTQVL
jgi:hypothetical protein